MLVTIGIVVSLILNVICLFYIYKLEGEKEIMERHIYDVENQMDRRHEVALNLLEKLTTGFTNMHNAVDNSLNKIKEMINKL